MKKGLHLYQLTYFKTLAGSRSFADAARACYITPSALTQSVNSLEREMGARLVERGRRRVLLTPAGERLLAYCRLVLDATDALTAELADGGKAPTGMLRVAAFPGVGLYGLSSFLTSFRERHPAVEIMLHLQGREYIVERLADGELDAALLHGVPLPSNLRAEDLFTDEWVLLARPDHPLARKRAPRVADLAGHAFLSAQLGSAHDSPLLRTLRRLKLDPPIHLRADDLEAIKRLLLEGWGLATLPLWMVREELARKRLVALPLDEFRRKTTLQLVLRSGSALAPPLRLFRDAVRGELARHMLDAHPGRGARRNSGS